MLGLGGANTVPSSSTATSHFQSTTSMSSYRLLPVLASPLKDVSLRQCGSPLRPAWTISSYSGRCSMFLDVLSCRHFSLPSSLGKDLSIINARETSSPSTQLKMQKGWPSVVSENVYSLCLRRFESFRRVGVLGTGGSFFFGSSSATLADTIEDQAPSQVLQPTDQLLSVLFTTAFIGLSFLTIGVIYLAVWDFLENRKLSAMQKEAAEELKEGEKKEKVRVGNVKGFGVPKVDKKVEKKAEKQK